MSIQVNGFFPGNMQPDSVVGGCINIFENVWPNIKETIEEIENECSNVNSGISWHRAETIGMGLEQNIRTNYNIDITHSALYYDNQVCQNIHNQFYVVLLSSLMPYITKYDIPQLYHENYQLLKYSGGQKYDAHSDGVTENGRSVSAILYLNNDYEGGEIEFVNFGIKIKPEPGMLILFPSNYAYRHIAHPVTSGTKYAIVTWLKDRQL